VIAATGERDLGLSVQGIGAQAGVAGRDVCHPLQPRKIVAQSGQQFGRERGCGLGRALDEPRAAGLALILPYHIQVDACDELAQFLFVLRQVGKGSGHLGQPQEADGPPWSRQPSAGDERLQGSCRFKGRRRSSRVVVGRRQRMAQMSDD
jgi:hypothetical protein